MTSCEVSYFDSTLGLMLDRIRLPGSGIGIFLPFCDLEGGVKYFLFVQDLDPSEDTGLPRDLGFRYLSLYSSKVISCSLEIVIF